MREVNVTELRNHLPHYLASAYNGAEILVTSHGKIIARIIPPVDTKLEAQKQLKNLRKKCKITDVISPIDESWESDQ